MGPGGSIHLPSTNPSRSIVSHQATGPNRSLGKVGFGRINGSSIRPSPFGLTYSAIPTWQYLSSFCSRKKPWEGPTSRPTWVSVSVSPIRQFLLSTSVHIHVQDRPASQLLTGRLLAFLVNTQYLRSSSFPHNCGVSFYSNNRITAPMVFSLPSSPCSKPIRLSPFAVHSIVASSRQPFRRETYPSRSQVVVR